MDELFDGFDRESRHAGSEPATPHRRRGFFGFLAGLLGGFATEHGFEGPDGESRRRQSDRRPDDRASGAPIAVVTRATASIGTEIACPAALIYPHPKTRFGVDGAD